MQIQVLVEIPGIQNQGLFNYLVPISLQDQVEPGKRVLIPLGNQVTRGFVFEIGPDNEGHELKPILEVLDDEPILIAEMLELAKWMADYYLAPLDRVVKAMFPSVLNDPSKERVVWADEPPEDNIPGGIDKELGFSWKDKRLSPQELIKLFRNGQIKVEVAPSGKVYSPAVQYSLSSQVSEETITRIKKRAPRQARALRFFMDLKSPVSEREAVDAVGTSVLNRLVEKGLIERQDALPGVHQDLLPNREQAQAIEQISRALDVEEKKVFLLFGVTGSGKTEVYLKAIEQACQRGQQSLVLIPEIGLTQQMIGIFEQRLGPRVSVLHSRITQSERVLEWLRVREGEADVVIGARSAVFAPFKNLGLIIMDEEQEPSFRQDETPRYHAREVAIKRAEFNNAVVVLGSATPCLESFYRAQIGEFDLLRLSQKIASSGQRAIRMVDIKRHYRYGNQVVSPELLYDLEGCVESGDQAIVFINRRGYSTTVLCPNCGLILTCRSCEVALNYHRDINRVVCHYCGSEKVTPRQCPGCKNSHLRFMGTGTQKVEAELRHLIPKARIIRMDTDSTRIKGGHQQIIQSIRDGEVDIAVGTQMIAKGFDFPGVALVGVINADPLLGLPDFRARERAFQLMVQVAGRAGRGATKGKVLIQTVEPDASFFELVQKEDFEGFYHQEIAYRLALGYPPFTHLIKLVFSGSKESLVKEEADFSRMLIDEMVGELDEDIDVLGPAPCIRSKIKNRYRYQMLLKSSELGLMRSITRYIINRGLPSRVRLEVDVDPLIMI